jgi:peptide/nickel transport system permease protein
VSPALLQRFRRNRPAVVGLVLLIAIATIALSGAALYPGNPWDVVGRPFLWPGEDSAYPLGTDTMGRDLAAGLAKGALGSLLIGLVATAMAAMVGIGIGILAGYYGGWIDNALMRVTKIFETLPPFILAIVIVAILRPSVWTVVFAIGLVSWPAIARVVHGEFNALREREFVLAGIAQGMSDARIIATQIFPNALRAIVISAVLNVATAILLEAGLAFVGLGDPGVMRWGTIIGTGRDALQAAWYIAALPALAILVTVLAINLMGRGLSAVLDPGFHNR